MRAVVLLGLLATFDAGNSHAQWVQTNGPRGGSIGSLLAVPNGAGARLYAGQLGVWRTDNGGGSWSHFTDGLTNPNIFNLIAVPNGSGGNDILAGTNGGVFRSTDEGVSWSPINNGLTNLTIYGLASGANGSGGTNLYAGTFNGTFRSTDNGASWHPIQSGLPLGNIVNELATTPVGTVLAGTANGIYRSTNFGATWTQVLNGYYGFSFTRNGSTLYAGTSSGVHRSTNDGATWTPINNGIQFTWVLSMAAIPSGQGVTLFAGAGRVLRSTDNGANWTLGDDGTLPIDINALVTAPNGSGGTDLFAGTGEGVFHTGDNGDHWTNVSFVFSHVQGLGVTPSGAILAGTPGGNGDIYRSANGGALWTDTNAQCGALHFAVNPQGTSGISLFAVDPLTGVRKSTDDGVTWTDSNNDIGDIEVNSVTVMPNAAGDSHVIAGTYSGIFLSTDDGGSWVQKEPLFMPLDFVVTPNGAGGQDIFGGGFNGVWRSTNYGQTWSHMGLGEIIRCMAATANGANLFAGGDPFGVYRSTDHGVTWTLVNNGLTDLRIFALLSPDGIHLFAAGADGVFLSADNGNTWSTVSTGLTTGVLSLAMSDDGLTMLAGTTGFGVWKRPLSEMITTAAVDDASASPSSAIVLRGNAPNPFRDGTTIEYALPRAMSARLVVYDVAGHAVRTLVSGTQSAGERRVTWDGRNENGAQVSRGIYLYRLEADGATQTRKMILH